jgi:hypothetical protein
MGGRSTTPSSQALAGGGRQRGGPLSVPSAPRCSQEEPPPSVLGSQSEAPVDSHGAQTHNRGGGRLSGLVDPYRVDGIASGSTT